MRSCHPCIYYNYKKRECNATWEPVNPYEAADACEQYLPEAEDRDDEGMAAQVPYADRRY